MTRCITSQQARRLLMHAQGLGDDPSRRAGPIAVDRLVRQLGFVQIDSIQVLERAQHLTLKTRLNGYRREHLRTLLEDRRTLFEHWTHDASAIPVAWMEHWTHRYRRYRQRVKHHEWWQERVGPRPGRLFKMVLDRIDQEGPMRSRDFEDAGSGSQGWWNWKPAKAALEHLWRNGQLAVASRDPRSQQKIYDLTDRVFPAVSTLKCSTPAAHRNWACHEALGRLGTATPSELAGFFGSIDRGAAQQWCRRGITSGTLMEVDVERADGRPPIRCVAFHDIQQLLDTATSCHRLVEPDRLRLLGPFDPVIRDRKRLSRLFGFEYRFEAFTPAAKRVFGYYVLPILEGDQLIGRVDLKTDRAEARLLVKGLFWEEGIAVTPRRRRWLSGALEEMATFVGATDGVDMTCDRSR